MLSPAASPLLIDCECRQASCHFDINSWHERTPQLLGLTLPQQLEAAVTKRKAEFVAGRYCAAQALEQLGWASASLIGVGPHREPLWPEGIVGSITHTQGYASAAVARRGSVRAVGIDSETWLKPATAREIGRHILTPGECHDAYVDLFESPHHYLTLVFSAKESLYKCLFPLVNDFFGFHSARIHPLHDSQGQFRFELLEDLNTEFCAGFSGLGSYCIHNDLVHTAILLPATAAPASPAPQD